MVLVYHFFREQLPGGFLGVDLFFTLSGYLITALLIEGFRKSGEFRFLPYLKRRLTRIFPPLFFAILITLPFTLLISPDFTAGISRQIAAAFGFVTNYFEVLTGGSYEGRLLPHLFLHTWALAVEMHFYLLWGLLFAGLALVLKRSPATVNEKTVILRALVFVFSMVLAVAAYSQMQILYGKNIADPSAAYFGTQTHGFTFMLGAATGALFGLRQKGRVLRSTSAAVAFSVCGIALSVGGIALLALTLDFNSGTTYRFGFLFASLLTIVIIKCALVLHARAADAAEPRALTVISALSYCLYLFHWPLYIVFGQLIQSNALAAAVALALSVAFSSLVVYVLEPAIAGAGKGKAAAAPGRSRSGSAPRALWRAAVSLSLLAAVVLSGMALKRAPEINPLEADLYAGYLFQDIDSIGELHDLTRAINGEPLDASNFPAGDGSAGNGRGDAMPMDASIGQAPTPVLEGPAAGFENDSPTAAPEPPAPTAAPARAASTGTSLDASGPGTAPAAVSGDILGGVIVIGDSVCLGARKNLTDTIPDCYVDAEGSRQVGQGYNLLMQLQSQDRLREYVVVALGTNGNANSPGKIDQIIADIQPGHRLVFVTPYDGRATPTWHSYKTAEYIRTLPEKHPFVTVADWAETIAQNASLLGSDKVHIGGQKAAVELYTNCIIEALNVASGKPAKE